jgi:tetratricopeptide (TPR) repeat protein
MGLAALMLLPLALFSGAAFPFLVRAYTGDDTAAGRKTGALYAANTAAGVAGSLAAGFLFLPWIGAQWALFALTGLLLLAAGGTLIRAAPLRLDTATWIGAGVIAALAGAFLPGPRLLADLSLANFPSGYRALMTHEDVAATVMVLERRDNRIVTVNETPVAGMGDFMLRNTQILQGYIPLMAHPRPRRVAMIGFGAGETADVIASAQPEAFDLAELCPGVFKAAPFFQSINFGIERAPLPRQIIMDGKNYLKLTGHKYDIVMNDCVHPSYLGNASLYCRDHFEAGRRALADDGLMTSWLPIYELETLSVRSMINTFASVFPNCALLYAPTCFNFHALLIGRKQPGPILSLARSQQLLEREDVRRRLGQIDVDDPLDLINFVMLGPQGIAAHFGDAPIITDNHPSLEFDAARVPRQDHAYFWQNVRYLASLREDPLPYIDLAGAAQVETLLAAQPARYRATGTMLEVIGDNDLYPGQAEAIVDEAVALSPGLAGSAAMKTQIRSNLARGRQAPMVCGSRGRQEQAEALLQAGQFDRAAAVLEAEVRKNPANFKAVGTLGMARLRQGDIAGGAKLFDQVLAVNPNDALAFWHLGEIAARKHDWPKAEERYRRALELFGPAPGLYGELGQVRRSVGDPAGAIEWFREGIRRFPNEVSLLLAYAETLYDLGQAPEAAQAAQRALELNPSDWRAREMLRQMTAAGAPAP